jgi:hypothetical protein
MSSNTSGKRSGSTSRESRVVNVPLIHFLLVYDHSQRRLVLEREFTDAEEAGAAYAALEREHRTSPAIEVVLVGSDSLETVKQTHGNYFEAEDDADVAYLVGG